MDYPYATYVTWGNNNMQNKITVNASFHKKIKGLEVEVLGGVKGRLEDIAKSAVNLSPVDTGAYVTSFSYAVGGGRPRGKDSDNRPTATAPEGEMAEGYDNLMQDLSRVKDIKELDGIQLRNGSPHADDVEYGKSGGYWKNTEGYYVFAKLRDMYG